MAEQRTQENAQEVPKYRLTEVAYIDDKYLDPKAPNLFDKEADEYRPLIIEFAGVPGHHMQPMNAAARAAVEKKFPNGQSFTDPVEQMAMIR